MLSSCNFDRVPTLGILKTQKLIITERLGLFAGNFEFLDRIGQIRTLWVTKLSKNVISEHLGKFE